MSFLEESEAGLVAKGVRELSADQKVIREFVNEVGGLVKKYAPLLGATGVSSILFNTAVKFIGEAREHAHRTQTYKGINTPLDELDEKYVKGNEWVFGKKEN